jgi:nicotinate-nucleotide pyrophosphorylase (carboxylating)
MLTQDMYIHLVRASLAEDIGTGDATTLAVVPETMKAEAIMLAKEDCVCAGLPVAEAVFRELDPAMVFTPLVKENEFCPAGTVIAKISGQARALLTGERTALNFIQRLSGIATMSRLYQHAVGHSKTRILDTRKTTPGWRLLEKYAVAAGGAENHRIGLYDRIMIKDNHRELAKIAGGKDSIAWAVQQCRKAYPKLEIEVEADTLDDVREAANAGVEYILLDNMTTVQMAEAVRLIAGRAKTEASGGITLKRIPEIAAIGVDYISAGALTHSVKSADISLDIVQAKP